MFIAHAVVHIGPIRDVGAKFGREPTRTVVIGGAEHYAPGDMVGRTVVVLANLEPRTVAGVESEAMLLAADVDGKPFWLEAPSAVPPGSPVR